MNRGTLFRIHLKSIAATSAVIYIMCLALIGAGYLTKTTPDAGRLFYNSAALKVKFTETSSSEKRFVFISDNGQAEINLYGKSGDDGDFVESLTLKSQNQSSDQEKDIKYKYVTLMSDARFVLTLESDGEEFSYDFACYGGVITLSGFSGGVRAFLSSLEEIVEFSRPHGTEPLKSRHYEILDFSEISFKADSVIFDGSEKENEKKLGDFSYFEIVSTANNITLADKTYFDLRGVPSQVKGTASVGINPLSAHIEAELESASSGTQNVMPNTWLTPVSIVTNNKLEYIAAFSAIYIAISGYLIKHIKSPQNPADDEYAPESEGGRK